MSSPYFFNILGFGAMLGLLSPSPVWAEETNGSLKSETVIVAYAKAAFLNVNRADVEAGFKVLAQTVGRRRGYLVNAPVQVFDDAAGFAAYLQDPTVRLIVVDPWRYLSMDTSQITPLFVSSAQGKTGKEYVLLTRQGGGLNTLADLRGKELAVYEVANATQGRYWLETLLLENNYGNLKEFFARVESVAKPTAAVLPVFFGKKHACLVDRASFQLMKELNPQVGRAVQVVEASDLLVDSLICLRNSGWPPGTFREEFIQTLGEFHLDSAGAQILAMFKTDRLIPFQETDLDTIRSLRATYDRLRKESQPSASVTPESRR